MRPISMVIPIGGQGGHRLGIATDRPSLFRRGCSVPARAFSQPVGYQTNFDWFFGSRSLSLL